MRMKFHWWEVDGTIHVQNVIGGYLGQHHVHAQDSFGRWRRTVAQEDLVRVNVMVCDCGLKPGEVKQSHDLP